MNHAIEISSRPAHHREGGFRNPWPHSSPKGFGAVIKWMLTRSRSSSDSATSRSQSSTVSLSIPVRSTEPAISWIGHSSFLIQCDDINILTDPIWSDRASPVRFAGPRRLVQPGIGFDRLPQIDITLLSHDHYDHFDDATIRRLVERFPSMIWCAPLGVGELLSRRGAAHIIEMDWWNQREVAGLTIGCTPAQHFSGRYPWNRDTTLWCGWAVAFRSRKFFFAGDTALHPEFELIAERFGPFDVNILPIGAYEPRWFMRSVHMTPEDSVNAFQQLVKANRKESVMVGSHWGTFRLTDEPMLEPPDLTRSRWQAAGLPADRLWIMKHGETRSLGQGA